MNREFFSLLKMNSTVNKKYDLLFQESSLPYKIESDYYFKKLQFFGPESQFSRTKLTFSNEVKKY